MTKESLYQFEKDLNLYEKGPASKLQDLLDRMIKFTASDEYSHYTREGQDTLKELMAETKDKLQHDNLPQLQENLLRNEVERLSFQGNYNDHDQQAEKWVEEAEGFFYNGHYDKAIRLYENALKVEPRWERVKYHLAEAEDNLRRGTIPELALPLEVGTLFGKAQSAARLGDYERAKGILNSAKRILLDNQIQRWREGVEFEVQLDNNLAAINAANEAKKMFLNSNFDEAIAKLDAAADITGTPRYREQANIYRKFKDAYIRILSRLNGKPSLKLISDITAELESVEQEFGNNILLEQLRRRLDDLVKEKTLSILSLLEVSFQNSSGFDIERNPEYFQFLEFLSKTNLVVTDETTKIYLKILEMNKQLAFHGYEAYAKVLETLVVQYPLNTEMFLRYEWVNTKIRVDKSREQRRKDGAARITAFRIQALLWFVASIISAIALLATAIYVITLATKQDNFWMTLTSFLSVLPVFAARMFYDQSLEANLRVESMQEKMNIQEQKDIETDRRMEQQMFDKIRPSTSSNNKIFQSSSEKGVKNHHG